MKKIVLLCMFVLSILLTSSATAQTRLQTQQNTLKENLVQLQVVKAEIVAKQKKAKKRERVIVRKTQNGSKKIKLAKKRLAVARKEYDAQKVSLERQTAEYIKLAEQIGRSGAADNGDQQMLSYTLSANQDDAVIVYQTGGSLLDVQNQTLKNLRLQSQKTGNLNLKLQTRLGETQEIQYLVKSGLNDNRELQRSLGSQIKVINRRQKTGDRQMKTLARKVKLEQRLVQAKLSQNDPNLVPSRAKQDPYLTQGQWEFSYQVASITGMDVNVIKAWVLAEMSGQYAQARESAGNHNWMNIGYFDSLGGGGAFQNFGIWSNPQSAGSATAAFLEGKFLGASSSIQSILKSRNKPPAEQLKAIYTSNWATSHYHNGKSLIGTYNLLNKTAQPKHKKVRFKSPKDQKTYTLGNWQN